MSEKYSCPNCETINSNDAVFCQNCSQKINLKLNSVWRMIGDFLATLIDYDSKLFSSIRGLFKPGYLTNQYLLRKRVRYLTPIRLFVILMLSFFAVMSFQGYDKGLVNMNIENSNGVEKEDRNENKYYSLMEQSFQSLRFDLLEQLLKKELESNILKLENSIERLNKRISENENNDSEKQGDLDKLKKRQGELTQAISAKSAFDNMQLLIDNKKDKVIDVKFASVTYLINIHDVDKLTSQELIEKYQINHWLDKIIIVQMLKFNNDSKAFRKFIFKNLTWVVLLDLLLMSAVFKLFHIRTKRKYVEYFIYNLNIRSWLFFIGIILMLLPAITQTWVFLLLLLVLSIFLILSQKNVFQQSMIMTIFKFIVLFLINILVLLLSMLFVVLVSSLIF